MPIKVLGGLTQDVKLLSFQLFSHALTNALFELHTLKKQKTETTSMEVWFDGGRGWMYYDVV